MFQMFLEYVDRAATALLGLALLGELLLVAGNVIARTFFNAPFAGTVEASGLALNVLTFLGAAVAYRQRRHIAMTAIVSRLGSPWAEISDVAGDWLILGIGVYTAILGVPIAIREWTARSPELGLRESWFALPLVIGMLLLAVYACSELMRRERRTVIWAGGFIASLTILVLATKPLWSPMLGMQGAIWGAIAVFALLAVIGVPIAFVLAIAALAYLYASNQAPLAALPMNMQQGVGNFVLLALPFFIFAGLIMEKGGIGERLIAFIRSLVGRARGGLLQVVIVSMYLVSGLSGSKAADIAAVGLPMMGALREGGYTAEEGVAVLASSAGMGELVPPSIAMLILGSITSLSMGSLFVSGLLPAAVIALCLMATVYVRARRAGRTADGAAPSGALRSTAARAVLPLLLPVILFGGILGGIGTPTEVSSFAVIYGLALTALYRKTDLHGVWTVVVETASLSGVILLIIGAASAFSWSLTVANIPQAIGAMMDRLPTAVFILCTIGVLIVMGSVLEGLPALLIFGPLLLPVATHLGVAPLHYGIVLIAAMGIGTFAPPIGVGYYIACAIGKVPPERAFRPMLPYLVVLVLGLIVVGFVPWFTMVIPHAFHMSGAT